MTSPPPSLRVYTLAKHLTGLFSTTDVLDADGQLLAELEVYALEETRASNERHERELRRMEQGARRPATRRGRRLAGR